jgi:outer membrane protein assembly factor BamB
MGVLAPVGAVGAVVLTLAGVVAVSGLGDRATRPATPVNVAVGGAPTEIATSASRLWVLVDASAAGGGSVVAIARDSGTVDGSVELAGPTAIAVADGPVWATALDGSVVRIAEADRTVTWRATVPAPAKSVAVAGGIVWVVAGEAATPSLVGLDAASGAQRVAVRLGGAATSVTAAFGSLWVGGSGRGVVERRDADTGRLVATVAVPDLSDVVCAPAGETLWCAGRQQSTLVAVYPAAVAGRTVDAGGAVAAIVSHGTTAWVTTERPAMVRMLDAAGLAGRPASVPAGTWGVAAADDGNCWIALNLDAAVRRVECG